MAGTRIKIKGEFPAAALETTYITYAATPAIANAWLDGFDQTMASAGFVRTLDSGQLGLVTANVTTLNTLGFRCYALVDEYSETSPLILKCFFAGRGMRGSASGPYYRVRCVSAFAGFSTDGNGAFVGLSSPQVWTLANGSPAGSTSAWQFRADTYAWRLDHSTLIALGPSSSVFAAENQGSYVGAGCEFFICVSRCKDLEGNLVLGAFNIHGGFNASAASTAINGYAVQPVSCLLLEAGPAPILSGGCARLSYPTPKFVSGPDSKPVLQHALWGQTPEGVEYAMPGITAWSGINRLTPGVPISTDSIPASEVMPLGHLIGFLDVHKITEALRGSGGTSWSAYSGSQLIQADYGIALDWSDA